MKRKVALIGAGIAALGCAVSLKEQGIDFIIFEKGRLPGGKIVTEKFDNLLVEGGPDSYLPEKYWSVELIKKVGLEGEMLCTNDEYKGTYIYSRGRLHPLPEGVMLMVPTMITPLVKSTLLSWPGKIRMGLELFVPPKKDLSDESLAQFVTRRLGRECLELIAEPLVAGIHTSNPDNMSVLATFPRFAEMERKYGSLIRGILRARKQGNRNFVTSQKMTYFMSLREGMYELVRAAVKFIGEERVKTETTVVSVNKREGGYEVVCLDGTVYKCDAVVIATPSFVTAELIRGMDEELAEQLSQIKWSSSATVSLAFRKKEMEGTLRGFGFIVPRREGRKINACTYSSIKWSNRAPEDVLLLRCFVGGGHHEELVFCDDGELLEVVLAELREIIGFKATPFFSRIYRWERGMPKYTVGHLERISAVEERLKLYPGLFFIGSSYRGIGIGDCVRSGFVAAEEIRKAFLP